MEDINVNSILDFKTYFNISMLIQFRTRSLVIMAVYLVLVEVSWFAGGHFKWTEGLIILGIFAGVYGIIIPLVIYFVCKRNMKKVISAGEPKVYTINANQVTLKAETMSATITWQHLVRFMEREHYFLLMPSRRTFHYLPKAGFQSQEDIAALRNLARTNGIKMSFH